MPRRVWPQRHLPQHEWYLTAERPLPPAEFYDAFAQLEDGVGMWRLYHDTFLEELEKLHGSGAAPQYGCGYRHAGRAADPGMRRCSDAEVSAGKDHVHEIKNEYFGGNAAWRLVTGTDIIKQCSGKLHSDLLAVPEVMIRDEKGQFLDDITLEELAERWAAAPSHPHRRRRMLQGNAEHPQAQNDKIQTIRE